MRRLFILRAQEEAANWYFGGAKRKRLGCGNRQHEHYKRIPLAQKLSFSGVGAGKSYILRT